jgi:hypothetical protein
MKSKKGLIITLLSVFVICTLLVFILFAVLTTYSRYQYAQTLKLKSGKQVSDTRDAHDGAELEALAKVTFIIGDAKCRKRSEKNWGKLRFGQKLVRGDSIQVTSECTLELTLKNDKTIALEGYKKIRIDGSLLRMSDKTLATESAGSSEESGKFSRLTGKEGSEKETTPVSAIRSNVPSPKKDDKKSNLKTKIGE